MNNYKIIKGAMVIFAFIKSFPLGIMILVYLIIMEQKTRDLEAQIKASIEEDETPSDSFEKPGETAEKFVTHKDCIIEKHGKSYYVIKPSGEYLKKIFKTVEDATSEIDTVAPFFPPKPDTRQKVHNIRFVR